MQCMDVTNSTKFRLPLLSLSNVENIKVETFSTVSTGSNKLNISCTFTFSNVPFKIFEYLNILQILDGSPDTCGHSRMNWRYHSLTSSTRNLVLVTRNSTSSSVRDAFRARVLSRLAFHRSLDFIQLRTVPKPATVDSIDTNIKYHQNIDS